MPDALVMEQRFIEWEGVEVRTEKRADGVNLRSVRGYAAMFNKLSLDMGGYRERIKPGAFASTVGNDIVALWSHNPDIPLARVSNETLKLAEDEKGLRFEFSLGNDAWADFAFEKIQRRDVKGMSFGFRWLPDGYDWERDEKKSLIRNLLKLDLVEISPTAFPAYPATSVAARNIVTNEQILEQGLKWLETREEKPGPERTIFNPRARLRLVGAC